MEVVHMYWVHGLILVSLGVVRFMEEAQKFELSWIEPNQLREDKIDGPVIQLNHGK